MNVFIDSKWDGKLDFRSIWEYTLEDGEKVFVRWLTWQDYEAYWLALPKYIPYDREPIVNKKNDNEQLNLGF